MSINICKSNGRLEQIESVLAEHFSKPVKLVLEVSGKTESVSEQQKPAIKTVSQKRNEILNDPAVKTVITELGATVMGIEESIDDK